MFDKVFVYVVLLRDTALNHGCCDLVDIIYTTEELAKKRVKSYEDEDRANGHGPTSLQWVIERKLLHRI